MWSLLLGHVVEVALEESGNGGNMQAQSQTQMQSGNGAQSQGQMQSQGGNVQSQTQSQGEKTTESSGEDTGSSTGIVPYLDTFTTILFSLTMILGRLVPLYLAFSLVTERTSYRFVRERVTLG